MDNEITLSFIAKSENEALARMVMSSFISAIDPTIEELSEFKTVISEAVTNAIVHGYEEDGVGKIEIHAQRSGREIVVSIVDYGRGIKDVTQAREPLYTTKPEQERSGMGFTIMESFSDDVDIYSIPDRGTTVTITKKFVPIQESCRIV